MPRPKLREAVKPMHDDRGLNDISLEYCYHDLRMATCNFSSYSRIGQGAYGDVYRGTLGDGNEVAIKLLNASQQTAGFEEEVKVLSKFRHQNLVILMGFARNGNQRLLVYELLPGGDVGTRLNQGPILNWRSRLSIALDAACGLSHLHNQKPKVFHRDIKCANILLDRNGSAKWGDFGLACLSANLFHKVTQTAGTVGYADPMYITSSIVTEKSEVYSYGWVLIELLTRRPPAVQLAGGSVTYFSPLLRDSKTKAPCLKKLMGFVDYSAGFPQSVAQKFATLALTCVSPSEKDRPDFRSIVRELRTLFAESNRPDDTSTFSIFKPVDNFLTSRVPNLNPTPFRPWPVPNCLIPAAPPCGPQRGSNTRQPFIYLPPFQSPSVKRQSQNCPQEILIPANHWILPHGGTVKPRPEEPQPLLEEPQPPLAPFEEPSEQQAPTVETCPVNIARSNDSKPLPLEDLGKSDHPPTPSPTNDKCSLGTAAKEEIPPSLVKVAEKSLSEGKPMDCNGSRSTASGAGSFSSSSTSSLQRAQVKQTTSTEPNQSPPCPQDAKSDPSSWSPKCFQGDALLNAVETNNATPASQREGVAEYRFSTTQKDSGKGLGGEDMRVAVLDDKRSKTVTSKRRERSNAKLHVVGGTSVNCEAQTKRFTASDCAASGHLSLSQLGVPPLKVHTKLHTSLQTSLNTRVGSEKINTDRPVKDPTCRNDDAGSLTQRSLVQKSQIRRIVFDTKPSSNTPSRQLEFTDIQQARSTSQEAKPQSQEDNTVKPIQSEVPCRQTIHHIESVSASSATKSQLQPAEAKVMKDPHPRNPTPAGNCGDSKLVRPGSLSSSCTSQLQEGATSRVKELCGSNACMQVDCSVMAEDAKPKEKRGPDVGVHAEDPLFVAHNILGWPVPKGTEMLPPRLRHPSVARVTSFELPIDVASGFSKQWLSRPVVESPKIRHFSRCSDKSPDRINRTATENSRANHGEKSTCSRAERIFPLDEPSKRSATPASAVSRLCLIDWRVETRVQRRPSEHGLTNKAPVVLAKEALAEARCNEHEQYGGTVSKVQLKIQKFKPSVTNEVVREHVESEVAEECLDSIGTFESKEQFVFDNTPVMLRDTDQKNSNLTGSAGNCMKSEICDNAVGFSYDSKVLAVQPLSCFSNHRGLFRQLASVSCVSNQVNNELNYHADSCYKTALAQTKNPAFTGYNILTDAADSFPKQESSRNERARAHSPQKTKFVGLSRIQRHGDMQPPKCLMGCSALSEEPQHVSDMFVKEKQIIRLDHLDRNPKCSTAIPDVASLFLREKLSDSKTSDIEPDVRAINFTRRVRMKSNKVLKSNQGTDCNSTELQFRCSNSLARRQLVCDKSMQRSKSSDYRQGTEKQLFQNSQDIDQDVSSGSYSSSLDEEEPLQTIAKVNSWSAMHVPPLPEANESSKVSGMLCNKFTAAGRIAAIENSKNSFSRDYSFSASRHLQTIPSVGVLNSISDLPC